MFKRKILIICTFLAGLIASNATAFDLNSAVLVEAQLRAVARMCTTESFAQKFNAQSRDQVAFSLIGEDKYQATKVEEVISQVEESISQTQTQLGINDPGSTECSNADIALHELFEIRKKALQEGKAIARELQQMKN